VCVCVRARVCVCMRARVCCVYMCGARACLSVCVCVCVCVCACVKGYYNVPHPNKSCLEGPLQSSGFLPLRSKEGLRFEEQRLCICALKGDPPIASLSQTGECWVSLVFARAFVRTHYFVAAEIVTQRETHALKVLNVNSLPPASSIA
jgi:hypothetical protein